MNRLKDKMMAGAQAPDKFAAAEAAMSAGGLVPSAAAAVTPDPAPATPKLVKPAGGKRPPGSGQVVRESLTLLPEESAIIDNLRLRLATVGVIPNRSELLRAGILALKDLDAKVLDELLAKVPKLKPGRPT
jgi:hypothetical protein